MQETSTPRTAQEAGWHVSRYNLYAPIPGEDRVAAVSLYRGVCAAYTAMELYFLAHLDLLPEGHPLIKRFAEKGLIANFDEREALTAMGRLGCSQSDTVCLTICPTMGCNFDCPYCFEKHTPGRMSREIQDQVIRLAERMLDASRARRLFVMWFGGEPLLAPDIIRDLSERLIALAREKKADYAAGIVTNGYLLTEENAQLLQNAQVMWAQVTLDGMQSRHDQTRCLAGGRPTFDRIIKNLREVSIPFPVIIRQNVHEGNREDMLPLAKLILRLKEESGNHLGYYPHAVFDSDAAEERGRQVSLLCGSGAGDLGLFQGTIDFQQGQGLFCGAGNLWTIGIDDQGRLNKCWEDSGNGAHSFGDAAHWDPLRPLETAAHPENLIRYLNAGHLEDPECRDCVWLPRCRGGCPYQRLFRKKECLPYKDHPEKYVLSLYRRLTEAK